MNEPRNRFSRAWAQWRTHSLLWSHRNKRMTLADGGTIPGPKGYPAPWRLTHVRCYLCTLSGGCRWGKPYPDDLLGGEKLVVRCWKCRSTWVNWQDFEEGQPRAFPVFPPEADPEGIGPFGF